MAQPTIVWDLSKFVPTSTNPVAPYEYADGSNASNSWGGTVSYSPSTTQHAIYNVPDPVVAGRTVINIQTRESVYQGGTAAVRCASYRRIGVKMSSGAQRRWLLSELYLPSNFPTLLASGSGWMTWGSLGAQPATGPAPATLSMRNGSLWGASARNHLSWVGEELSGPPVVWRGPEATTGVWWVTLRHMLWNGDAKTGHMEIWLGQRGADGKMVAPMTLQTLTPTTGATLTNSNTRRSSFNPFPSGATGDAEARLGAYNYHRGAMWTGLVNCLQVHKVFMSSSDDTAAEMAAFADPYVHEGAGTGGTPVPTLTNVETLDTDVDTWTPFSSRLGSVTAIGTDLRLDLTATVPDSRASTPVNSTDFNVVGRKLVYALSTVPARTSNTAASEFRYYGSADFGGDNRVYMRRQTVLSAAGAVTSDVVRCGLSIAGVDAAPIDVPVANLPVSSPTVYALGFIDATTVSYQVGTNTTTLKEVARRTIASGNFSPAAVVGVGLYRQSGDVVTSSMTVDRFFATTSPAPSPGGTVTKASTALHLDGTVKRIFPTLPTAVAHLKVLKPADAAKVYVPASQSKAGSPLLDAFTRADNASVGASYLSAGGTLPGIASNAATSAASVVDARALWSTAVGAEVGVWMTVGNKPANPATTVNNWLDLFARVANSGATTQGYALTLSLTTAGSSTWRITRISSGNIQSPELLNLGLQAVAAGDRIGLRVFGTGTSRTLSAWYRPVSTGVWAQIGADHVDTTYVYTGTLVGFGMSASGTTAQTVDDLNAAPTSGAQDTFPPDRGGRESLITTGRQPQFKNNLVAPPGTAGSGTMPTGAWCMTLEGQEQTGGVVRTRLWDGTTFAHNENVAALGIGSAITDTAARYVVGGRQPGPVTEVAYNGDLALSAAFSSVPSAADFEGLVQPGGVVSSAAIVSIPGCLLCVDWTTLVAATDQGQDLSGNANHEITGERVGTGTIATDTNNVPVGAGTTTPPPTPGVSVPDPTGFTAVSGGVSLTDATKGIVDMSVVAPVATANFTPHATAPIQFLVSADGGLTYTGLGWQAATTYHYALAPVDTGTTDPDNPDAASTATRWYSVQYRDNTTPVVGDPYAPPIDITIAAATLVPLATPQLTRAPKRTTGGLLELRVAPAPSSQSVDSYHVYLTPRSAAGAATGAEFLAFDGPGVLSGTEVILSVTGLSDAVPRYGGRLAAWRTEP